jgi:hypothetical protein
MQLDKPVLQRSSCSPIVLEFGSSYLHPCGGEATSPRWTDVMIMLPPTGGSWSRDPHGRYSHESLLNILCVALLLLIMWQQEVHRV